mmetsp:Transcript_54241/g.99532  ORF Transcript_54241/g.99532 Transcript_54241/m.99532 type:complete len:363 (-) Transcript_54241:57-1145(-)
MELSLFNMDHGFSEALVRGFRSGFLGPEDYRRVGAADTLEDVRSALEETDYGTFLQDEPSPILVSTIAKKCYEKLADEFMYLKAQSVEPLTSFLEFIAREKMIDNVCMIIQSALNNKAPVEMEEKIHPMGTFDSMRTIMHESFDVSSSFDEMYRIFLVETPIGKYFEAYLKEAGSGEDGPLADVQKDKVEGILTQQDLEIMKASLKKAWLEDFYGFCSSQGGTTAEVMGHMLMMEADFRTLLVTFNSLNTALSAEGQREEVRNSLYPTFGYLYPEGFKEVRRAWNDTTVRAALEPFPQYLEIFEQVKEFYDAENRSSNLEGAQSIEDVIYKSNVHEYEMAFEQQYHFGVFYAWVKLRKQVND